MLFSLTAAQTAITGTHIKNAIDDIELAIEMSVGGEEVKRRFEASKNDLAEILRVVTGEPSIPSQAEIRDALRTHLYIAECSEDGTTNEIRLLRQSVDVMTRLVPELPPTPNKKGE